jgi:hypothetical protein
MPVTDSPGLGDLNGPGFDPWASALRIVAAHGSALWADDIALRRLARSQGIPSFSTLSLLDAYASIGLVPAGQREEAIRRLIRGYVGNFAGSLACQRPRNSAYRLLADSAREPVRERNCRHD